METEVASHGHRRIVSDEDPLQHLARYCADTYELNLRVGSLGGDAFDIRIRGSLSVGIGIVEADAVGVVGAGIEAHYDLAVGGCDGRVNFRRAGADLTDFAPLLAVARRYDEYIPIGLDRLAGYRIVLPVAVVC